MQLYVSRDGINKTAFCVLNTEKIKKASIHILKRYSLLTYAKAKHSKQGMCKIQRIKICHLPKNTGAGNSSITF